MNKTRDTILTVILLLVLGVIGHVVDSKYFSAKIVLEMPPIVAVVTEDLVGNTGNSDYAVVKFYSGEKEVSDYLAIPTENIGHDLNGKLGVAIYDYNSTKVKYVAEVDQSRALVASSSGSEYPPFFADLIEFGDVCFATDSIPTDPYVVSCDESSVLSILFEGDKDDGDPAEIKDIIADFEYLGFKVDFGEYSTSSILLNSDLAEDQEIIYPEYAKVKQSYHKAFEIEVNTDLLKFGAI